MSDWNQIGTKFIVGLDGPPLPVAAILYVACNNNGRQEVTHSYNPDTNVFTRLRENGPVDIIDNAGTIEFWIGGDFAGSFQDNIFSVGKLTDKTVSNIQPSILFYRKSSAVPARLATLTKNGILSAFKFSQVTEFETDKSQFRFFNGEDQMGVIGPKGVMALEFKEAGVFGDEEGSFFADESQQLLNARP